MIQDAALLVSLVNTKLRDFYDSPEALCEDMDYDFDEMERILNGAGYFYDPTVRQYKAK